MLNNMKSMLRLAKVFGNETTHSVLVRENKSSITNDKNTLQKIQKTNIEKEVSDNNYPNFFI